MSEEPARLGYRRSETPSPLERVAEAGRRPRWLALALCREVWWLGVLARLGFGAHRYSQRGPF